MLNAYLPLIFTLLAQNSPQSAYTNFMPSVYTHFLTARKTFEGLPSHIQDKIKPHLAMYYFGAQGADFCFFYKFLRPKKGNFGSFLHRQGAHQTFCVLQAFAKHSPDLYAYAAGYIAHYAADCVLHPFIYAAAGNSILTHSRIESGLDYLYGKCFSKSATEDYKRYFRPKLTKAEKKNLFLLYAAIATECGFPPLTKPAFFRAISIFNAYLPLSFTFLSTDNPSLLRRAFGIDYTAYAQQLLLSICTRTRALTEEFHLAVQKDEPLSLTRFGNSFLTGKQVN